MTTRFPELYSCKMAYLGQQRSWVGSQDPWEPGGGCLSSYLGNSSQVKLYEVHTQITQTQLQRIKDENPPQTFDLGHFCPMGLPTPISGEGAALLRGVGAPKPSRHPTGPTLPPLSCPLEPWVCADYEPRYIPASCRMAGGMREAPTLMRC